MTPSVVLSYPRNFKLGIVLWHLFTYLIMNVKIYRYVLKVKFEKMKPQSVVHRNFTFFTIILLTSYRTFNMHYQDAVRAFLSSNAGVIIRLVKLNMEFLWLSLIRKRTDYVSFKTLAYTFEYRFCSFRLFI